MAAVGNAQAQTPTPSDCIYRLDIGLDGLLHGRTDKLNMILFRDLESDGFEQLQGRANIQDVQVCSMSGVDSDGTAWTSAVPSRGLAAEHVTVPGIKIVTATLTGRQLSNCETTTYVDGGPLTVASATARIEVTNNSSGQSWNVSALPGHVLTVSTVHVVGAVPNSSFYRPLSPQGTLTTSPSAGNQRVADITAVACDAPAAPASVPSLEATIRQQVRAQLRSSLDVLRSLLPVGLADQILLAFGS